MREDEPRCATAVCEGVQQTHPSPLGSQSSAQVVVQLDAPPHEMSQLPSQVKSHAAVPWHSALVPSPSVVVQPVVPGQIT